MSLRARLLLGFAAIALVLIGADLVLAANVQKSLLDQIDQRLESAIGFSSRGFPTGFPGPRPPSGSIPAPETESNPRFTEFFLAELDSTGTLLSDAPPTLRDGDPAPTIDADVAVAHATKTGQQLR